MSPADGGLQREQDISGKAGDPSAMQCGQTYFPSTAPRDSLAALKLLPLSLGTAESACQL